MAGTFSAYGRFPKDGSLARVRFPVYWLDQHSGNTQNSHTVFRTAILEKLFDIIFSYKHCNFSRGCLLVKMASKSVTGSIIPRPAIVKNKSYVL